MEFFQCCWIQSLLGKERTVGESTKLQNKKCGQILSLRENLDTKLIIAELAFWLRHSEPHLEEQGSCCWLRSITFLSGILARISQECTSYITDSDKLQQIVSEPSMTIHTK